MDYAVEYITKERLPVLLPAIRPMIDSFIDCAADHEYTADSVVHGLEWNRLYGFVESCDGRPTFLVIFAIRKFEVRKVADVVVLVGEDFKGVRDRIWPTITQWMRDNSVTHVEGNVSDAMYRVCKRLFGFHKTSNNIRLALGE
jgi:hypothetical protein